MSIPQSNAYRREKGNFHLIPGRLRISVPGLLNNQELANYMAHRLAQFPRVRIAYANPLTGQVLVDFDHYKTDLRSVLSWILQIQKAERQNYKNPIPAEKNIRNQQGPPITGKTSLGIPWIVIRP